NAHQAETFDRCRDALAAIDVRIVRGDALAQEHQSGLRDRVRDEIQPLLTPFAMTLSPGHPLPRLGHLSLSMALILRQRSGGPPRFAELELPESLPRFFMMPGGGADPTAGSRVVVPVEEVIRGN